MKNRTKNIFIMIEIIVIVLMVGYKVNADYNIESESVYYANKNLNVKDSLDDLTTKLGDVNKVGTATQIDVLINKTLYSQGQLIEGNMINFSGQTVTSGD